MQVAHAMLTSLHYLWNFKYITMSSLLIPGAELWSKTLLVNETSMVSASTAVLCGAGLFTMRQHLA